MPTGPARCRLLPALLLLALVPLAPALPATAAPALVAAPAELALCPGRERLVRVTLSEGKFKSVPALRASTDSNVQVHTEPVGTPGTAGATWLARVQPPAGPVLSGTVHFMAEAPGAPPLAAAVALKVPDPASPFPARLEVQGAAESLPEGATARLLLVVGNSAATPLRLHRVAVADGGRPFQVAEAQPLGASAAVPPGGVLVLPFDVTVGATTPAAGKHRLVFQADLSGEFDGCPRSTTLVATRDLGYIVVGESAVLTALAIPSFLLVPGALCLLVPAVLWRFGLRLPGHDKDERFPLGPGTPEFWTVAVTLSIGAFALATKLGARTDLLVAYRLRDVVGAWVLSLVAGLAWYLPIWLVLTRKKAKRDAAAEAERAQRQWKPAEDPAAFLQRLAHRGTSLEQTLQPVDGSRLALGNQVVALFELEAGTDQVWLCPHIELNADSAPAEVQAALDQARANKSPAQLAEAVKAGTKHQVTLQWAPPGAWPVLMPLAGYQAARQGQPLVGALVKPA